MFACEIGIKAQICIFWKYKNFIIFNNAHRNGLYFLNIINFKVITHVLRNI